LLIHILRTTTPNIRSQECNRPPSPSLSQSLVVGTPLASFFRIKLIPPDVTFVAFTARTWALIGTLAGCVAISLWTTGFDLEAWRFNSVLLCFGYWLCLALILRFRGWIRVSAAIESICKILALTFLVGLMSIVLATTNLPLIDRLLESLDHLFFVDALTIARAQMDFPAWMAIMNYSYGSLTFQPFALIVLASVFNPNHLAKFTFGWTVSLCVCLAVFPFVPALGFYLHHGIDPASVPSVRVPAAWSHAKILLPARSGQLRELGWPHINGIITFPSFHAAAAILLAWGFSCTPWFFCWPALILNALMLVSTITIGGHYLVDVFAGCIVALGSILATKHLVESQIGAQLGIKMAKAGLQRSDNPPDRHPRSNVP
jgi:membrane-associated phospholipid phosphatase